MKRISIQGVKFGVADITIDGTPGKLLQFFSEKTEEFWEFPMGNEEASQMGSLLIGSKIRVAKEMPSEMPPPEAK